MATEASWEKKFWPEDYNYKDGSWKCGIGYAHDILGDLNNGTSGWVDWNILLNTQGGPNHVHNWIGAPMMSDDENLYIHPQYYFMGHFSKYLVPGSKRIKSQVLNTKAYNGKGRDYGTCTEEDG